MTGLIVTWDQQEIQAIDEGNFETVVVDVVDNFFEAVEGYNSVTVDWRTDTRNHGAEYRVTKPPLVDLDRTQCFIKIKGESRGGEYQLDLNPSGLFIETLSTGHKEELTFLQLREPGVAISPEEEEIFLKEIPQNIRKRVVETLPDI